MIVDKAEFYSGLEGTSPAEVAGLLGVLLASYWCRCAVSNRQSIIVDCIIYIVPLIVAFNTDNGALSMVTILGTTAFLSTLLLPIFREFQGTLEQRSDDKKDDVAIREWMGMNRKPFLTAYRGMMMLSTCCAILAVDFQVFPRRFAKTETFGFSLMDTGVGSLIISNGLVSSVRNRQTPNFVSSMLPALPMIILGGARCVSVKSTGYHEHVTEYGVHWNFFLTIAGVHIAFTLIKYIALKLNGTTPSPQMYCTFGAVVGLVYEYSLARGLEDWISNARREGVVAQNKEGICSLCGYFALFLGAAGIGQWLFSVEKSHSLPQWQQRRNYMWLITSIVGVTSWVWIEVQGYRPSRKMANMAYCLWVLFLNLTLISGYLTVDLFYRPSAAHTVVKSINYNQLAVFLLANVFTGTVNFTMDTIQKNNTEAYALISVYMAVLVTASAYLYTQEILLKFW